MIDKIFYLAKVPIVLLSAFLDDSCIDTSGWSVRRLALLTSQ